MESVHTTAAVTNHLESAILPALGHLGIGSVLRADVARCFHKFGRRWPGGANRCHEILRSMFGCVSPLGRCLEAADRAPVEAGGMRGTVVNFEIVVCFSLFQSCVRNTGAGTVVEPSFLCAVALGG